MNKKAGRKPIIENARKICISISEKHLEMLEQNAENENKTRSEFVRSVIERVLDKK